VGERGNGPIQAGGGAGAAALRVQDLEPTSGLSREQSDARLGLLGGLNADFVGGHPGLVPESHRIAYQRAVTLMRSESVRAFRLDEEPPALRDAYGRNPFGQGCLLARRLVERGVPFIEVALGGVDGNQGIGWDTHRQNFDAVKRLSGVLDPAWSTLMQDLRARGLLETTLIVWMGEFGRTPKINGNAGRDHFPAAWSTVLAGGGDRRRPGDRPHRRRRHAGRGQARLGPRPPGHHLPGSGDRPDDPERLEPRPPDPHRRPRRPPDPGGTRMRSALLALSCAGAVLSAGAAGAVELPEDVFADAPEDEIQDVVFFGPEHPVFLRFRIRVEGKAFRKAWGDFVVRLHRYLDGDHDGVLTEKELRGDSWKQVLRNPSVATVTNVVSGGKSPSPDIRPKDGKITIDELASYLRSPLDFGAFGVQPGSPPDPKAQAVFGHLDRDGDGTLSPGEMASTDACVRSLDLDEDDVLTLAEMLPIGIPSPTSSGGISRRRPPPGRPPPPSSCRRPARASHASPAASWASTIGASRGRRPRMMR
jgi:hypothetical protein